MKSMRWFKTGCLVSLVFFVTTGLRPLVPLEPLGARIVVNTTTDEYGDGDHCSLRESIKSANDDKDFDGCTHTGIYGHDTIQLPAGTYPLNQSASGNATFEDGNVYGDLDIEPDTDTGFSIYDLTLEGSGWATTIIDGNSIDRILDILDSAVVRITGLTLQNGDGYDDGKGGHGGGILNHGQLRIEDSLITNNRASMNNSSPGAPVGDGGGIYSNGSLSIYTSTISGNYAGQSVDATPGGQGGGIYIAAGSGTVTIVDSTLEDNDAGFVVSPGTGNGGCGGGIFNSGSDTHISRTSFIHNYAGSVVSGPGTGGDGGGLCNQGGTITLENTTLTLNFPGYGNEGTGGNGGAISNLGGVVELIHCTVARNDLGHSLVPGFTGGIESTADNSVTRLYNTIVALNLDHHPDPADQAPDCRTGAAPGNVFEAYHSIIQNPAHCNLDVSDGVLTGLDPWLGPLDWHGGPTQTILIDFLYSPALDAGDNVHCPAWDQRLYGRPFDGDRDGIATCDIGSVEIGKPYYLPYILKP